MSPPLDIVFMGTAAFAVPSLVALHRSRHRLCAVYTQPPRPAGRGHKLRPTPVHEAAAELGLDVRTPTSLKDPGIQAELRALAADVGVVAAYGLILPEAVLDAPGHGCLNLHGSLLPRWRGAAPVQRAIMAGDEETGIDIFVMEPGLDTGPVLASERVPIPPDATAGSLLDTLAERAARMVVPTVEGHVTGELVAVPQPETGVTYAHKIDKSEGRIDWHRPAVVIERLVRALEPHPGAFTDHGATRIRVRSAEVLPEPSDAPPGTVLDDALTVACEEGRLRLKLLQRAGGKPLDAASFLRGHPLPTGTRLG